MSSNTACFALNLLSLNGLVLLPTLADDGSSPAERHAHALTFQANIESLGFAWKRTDFQRLMGLPVATQAALYAQALPVLKDMVGVRTHAPMYPNFPRQVMDASDAELLLNAWLHYVGDLFALRLVPDYPVEKRPKLREKTGALKPLGLVDAHEALDCWERWTQATVAWSAQQRAAAVSGLAWAQEQADAHTDPAFADRLLRLSIPNRENKAVIAGAALHASGGRVVTDEGRVTRPQGHSEFVPLRHLRGLIWPMANTHATDVLRTVAAYAGGDVSLATPTRVPNLSRPVRRALMAQIEEAAFSPTAKEDGFARREAWLRLGERLHPGEFKDRDFGQAKAFFDAVRNEAPPVSWMAQLDAVLTADRSRARLPHLLSLISERPGLFARQLRRVLAWAGEAHGAAVLDAFAPHAGSVSTNVLLQAKHAFAHQGQAQRVVLPKGQVGRMIVTPKPAAVIPPALAERVVQITHEALVARFAQLEPLGKVYVDPALAKVPVPYALRSASRALRTLPRGSAVPYDRLAKVVRLFIWWHERPDLDTTVGRIDIDLSAVVYDEAFNELTTCSFRGLRDEGLTHSGDLTSAPKGASEFIDVEVAKLPKRSRYVAMMVNAFTSQQFNELPECFAGWMSRRSPQSGEIFEPRTVDNRFDLASPGRAVMPMVLDVKTGEVLWLDMPSHVRAPNYNAVVTQIASIGERIQALVNLSRPTLADLYALHVEARGEAVDDIAQADVALTLAAQDQVPGVCATDTDAITANWLADAAK